MTPRKDSGSDPVIPGGLLTADDVFLFNAGKHFRLYDKLGCHPGKAFGEDGAHFGTWAPGAREVSVIGDFNDWTPGRHPLRPVADSGLWEGFVPGVRRGARYKLRIVSRHRAYEVDKADPFGFRMENPPQTASVAWNLGHRWRDDDWMASRGERQSLDAPMSIYEMHLGSWVRDGESMPRYRDVAPRLVEYLTTNGFTHVELLPVMEHPFYGSWGYQTTGYFAATSRHGAPQDLMAMIEALHRAGIGVILDWVPSHFPSDGHGLAFFDGSHLFEHADPRQGFHPDWKTYIFNYNVGGVVSFLISSAMLWLDRFHADGIRVDAVASMLYLDYSRDDGEWIPNRHGGHENLEAIEFLRQLNGAVRDEFPDVRMIAEESTAWPMVSRPVYLGGLGFDMKWDMGWMHDTLEFFSMDPIFRKFHHEKLTFRQMYAYSERVVLALSHDEVVHGKHSLLEKMPGDLWKKFANLRLLYGYQFALPGKKLLFMGSEFGQRREWNHDASLSWDLLDDPNHEGVRRWVADLNHLYRAQPALHRKEMSIEGFEWIDCHDATHSVLTMLRLGAEDDPPVVVVCNFTPVPRTGYRIGVPAGGTWREALNSDATAYGGSGVGSGGSVTAQEREHHGRPYSVELSIPPLGVVFLVRDPDRDQGCGSTTVSTAPE